AAAASIVLSVVLGVDDDDTYTLRVIERIARRSGQRVATDIPGIVYLEIDGLGLPVLRRAMRDGHVPRMASWLADGTYRLVGWETDLSSPTRASHAGIPLRSQHPLPV